MVGRARNAPSFAGTLRLRPSRGFVYYDLWILVAVVALVAIVIVPGVVRAVRKEKQRRAAAIEARSRHADSGFAAMQSRGEMVMGVNQYSSAHVFENLPDGGRIVLDRDDGSDTAAVARIRQHMRGIAASFEAGDFTKPFQVHAEAVPGTSVMTARRSRITYREVDRPRGAEVRIRTTDSSAVRAVHDFLAFQRHAHHRD